MVGYVVGLGDRHGENILLDENNGEVVHVDFDCLFSKGLTLERPERVPFRLTPNIVDALGISGVEGLFRRSCETTMVQFMPVLCALQCAVVCATRSYLNVPLQGVLREHRETLVSVLQTFVHDPLVEWDHHHGQEKPSLENKKQQGRKILQDIDLRLKGMENPETLPLSVKGQVHQLISQAISEVNLSQMYIGWMSWL